MSESYTSSAHPARECCPLMCSPDVAEGRMRLHGGRAAALIHSYLLTFLLTAAAAAGLRSISLVSLQLLVADCLQCPIAGLASECWPPISRKDSRDRGAAADTDKTLPLHVRGQAVAKGTWRWQKERGGGKRNVAAAKGTWRWQKERDVRNTEAQISCGWPMENGSYDVKTICIFGVKRLIRRYVAMCGGSFSYS